MFHLLGNCIFSDDVIFRCFNGGVVMETLEQLKEIVKNAPEGKTMVSECYGVHYYWSGRDLSDLSMRCESVYGVLRSLSDIKRIIELMEENKELYEESAKDKGLS